MFIECSLGAGHYPWGPWCKREKPGIERNGGALRPQPQKMVGREAGCWVENAQAGSQGVWVGVLSEAGSLRRQ